MRKLISASTRVSQPSTRSSTGSSKHSLAKLDSMQTLNVNLGERSYPIHIGEGILAQAGEFLAQVGLRGKVAVITNPTVAQLYLDPVYDALKSSGFDVRPVLIPDGEGHKNLNTLTTIYDRLIDER